jgi:UDP-glucose 4-epimerase
VPIRSTVAGSLGERGRRIRALDYENLVGRLALSVQVLETVKEKVEPVTSVEEPMVRRPCVDEDVDEEGEGCLPRVGWKCGVWREDEDVVQKILITGISGGLGRMIATRLAGKIPVIGADTRSWANHPPGIEVYRADVQKRRFEDLIRTERPDAVLHLGFVRHFRGDESERHRVNVGGTKLLLDHCVKYGVRQLLVLSSSYVYGAFAENPYRLEEDAPLSGSRAYPEIRDLVELDTLASSFMWRRPEVATCVVRPVSVLGPSVESLAREFLRLRRTPTVLGYDPMMQFIHEEDLARALITALERELRGVFNIEGPGAVPLHAAIKEVGGTAWPLPDPPAAAIFDRLFRWGLSPYPAGMLEFMKYPVSLSGERFAAATGFRCEYGLREIFDSVSR